MILPYCHYNTSMAEQYGLGDPLFDSPEANIEYAPDFIARPGCSVLTKQYCLRPRARRRQSENLDMGGSR